MKKTLKNTIDKLKNEAKAENMPLFIVGIEDGKEHIFTVLPSELSNIDDKTKELYKKYQRAAMDFFKEDYMPEE